MSERSGEWRQQISSSHHMLKEEGWRSQIYLTTSMSPEESNDEMIGKKEC